MRRSSSLNVIDERDSQTSCNMSPGKLTEKFAGNIASSDDDYDEEEQSEEINDDIILLNNNQAN